MRTATNRDARWLFPGRRAGQPCGCRKPRPRPWLQKVTTPEGVVRNTTYNWVGEPLTETDGANNVTTTEYDGLGRVVKTKMPDLTNRTVAYDGAGRVTRVQNYSATNALLTTETLGYDDNSSRARPVVVGCAQRGTAAVAGSGAGESRRHRRGGAVGAGRPGRVDRRDGGARTRDVRRCHAQVGGRIDAHVNDFSQYRGRVWGGKRARPRLAMVGGVLAVPTRWGVHLWDLPAPAPARPPLPGPVRKPVLASVRWEGRDWLLTGSAEDGMVGLWDLEPPARRSTGHREQVARLDVAEPGVVVCVDDGGTIAARRTGDGSLVTRPTHTNVRGVVSLVAWVDGTSVQAATGAGSPRSSHPWLQRWDLVMREEMPPPIKLGVPQVRHVGMATVRGEKVLVVVDRELLQLRRAADGALLDEVCKDRGTYRLVTGPSDGGPIAMVSAIDRPPEVFRLEELTAPPSSVPGLHGGFAAALDGTRLVAGSLTERRTGWRTVWTCDLSGHPLGPDIGGPPITSIAIATWPAAFIARADGTVSLTDLESGHDLCPVLQLPAEARSIATADDGDLLVGVGTDVARFKPPIQAWF
ncbi:hypothetical protein [Micromonospora sp. NBC_01412]|uniref:hypothetical protein n=1 Tax=Micromonospora sp. NBC_01412 TaxID=2903590 RepID=UPI003255D175